MQRRMLSSKPVLHLDGRNHLCPQAAPVERDERVRCDNAVVSELVANPDCRIHHVVTLHLEEEWQRELLGLLAQLVTPEKHEGAAQRPTDRSEGTGGPSDAAPLDRVRVDVES